MARPEALGPFTRQRPLGASSQCFGAMSGCARYFMATRPQRTKTWKESNDPDRDAKLARIEEVLDQHGPALLRVRRAAVDYRARVGACSSAP